MDIEKIREYALSLPYVTENIQWGNDLVLKIAGKMFLVVCLEETNQNRLSLKCSEEKYSELLEKEGVIPAPYLARYKWVALQRKNPLTMREIENLIKTSYDLVYAKLPKKIKEQLKNS